MTKPERPIPGVGDRILTISSLTPGMSFYYFHYYEQEPTPVKLKTYLALILYLAEHFGANSTANPNYKDEIADILLFEMELVRLSKIDTAYDIMEAKDFKDLHPGFPIVHFVQHKFQGKIYFKEDDKIKVQSTYIKELWKLLQKTPVRVQANYLIWRIVFDSIPFLDPEVYEIARDFYNVHRGIELFHHRWEKCTENVGNMNFLYRRRLDAFKIATGSMLAR